MPMKRHQICVLSGAGAQMLQDAMALRKGQGDRGTLVRYQIDQDRHDGSTVDMAKEHI